MTRTCVSLVAALLLVAAVTCSYAAISLRNINAPADKIVSIDEAFAEETEQQQQNLRVPDFEQFFKEHARADHHHATGRGCVSAEYNRWLEARNPERARAREHYEANMARLIAQKRRGGPIARALSFPVTVRAVVHVIHSTSESAGNGDNISDQQINSQFDSINDDFRKLGAGNGAGVDVEVNFQLEQTFRVTWNTHGWEAPPYNITYFDAVIKPATSYNPDTYMNIWVAKLSGGVLGYAQLPTGLTLGGLNGLLGGADTDGIVITPTAFGTLGSVQAPYDGGRTLTHEAGHFFGLLHIWGDGDCATDYCDDTPPCHGPNGGCPLNTPACDTGFCMVRNYMDYTDDDCMNIFTQDQTDRMHVALSEGIRRKTIVASGTLQAFAASVVVIEPQDGFVCSGPIYLNVTVTNIGNFSFSNISYSVSLDSTILITSYVDFGVIPVNGTVNFVIDQPVGIDAVSQGLHTITVAVDYLDGNNNGNFISGSYDVLSYVLQNQGDYVFMDFEGIEFFPPVDWGVRGTGWGGYSNVPQPDGSYGISMAGRFSVIDRPGEQYSFYYIPGFKVTSSGLRISFDVSYALRIVNGSTVLGESLQVYIVGQCDDSIDLQVYSKSSSNLATVAPTTSEWVPSYPEDWRHEDVISVDPSIIGQSVTVVFVATGQHGNVLWVDNIKVCGSDCSAASSLQSWAAHIL